MLGHVFSILAHLAGAVGGRAPDAEPDLQLLRQAVAGAPAASRILVRRLAPVVQARALRVLRRLTPSHVDDADDICQKVWVVLLKDGGRQLLAFDPARGISLEAYVGMIAEREVRNHLQHELAHGRRPKEGFAPLEAAEEVPGPAPGPEAATLSADLAARLDAHLLGNLPPKGQLVLRLVYSDHLTPEEAATALGCQLQVVYNWQHRIRTLARAFMAAAGG